MKLYTITNGGVDCNVPRDVFEVFISVLCERSRQERLKNKGKFTHTAKDRTIDNPDSAKLAILMEEVGELARAVLEGEKRAVTTKTRGQLDLELEKELIQVCAVAFGWAQGIHKDKQEGNGL